MNKTHIIYVPFTGVGKNPYKGDNWFLDRIEIFKDHTLNSLLNQTNKNFILWLSFRPEDQDNIITHRLVSYLHDQNIDFFCSYEGLMYWDDKNLEANKTLEARLHNQLLLMQAYPNSLHKNIDYILMTRLDSDDMLHKDVVQLIQDQEPNTKALTLQLGYVFNKDTGEVAEWNPLTNPPFHTIIYPRDTFFDAEKHIAYYEGFKSHEDIARLPHKVLWREENRQDRLYCVLTHNPEMHISTNWDHPFKGKSVDPSILKEFGIGNR